jgi:hypothetical protein
MLMAPALVKETGLRLLVPFKVNVALRVIETHADLRKITIPAFPVSSSGFFQGQRIAR